MNTVFVVTGHGDGEVRPIIGIYFTEPVAVDATTSPLQRIDEYPVGVPIDKNSPPIRSWYPTQESKKDGTERATNRRMGT